MICKTCGKEFFSDWRKDNGKRHKTDCFFCSYSCSHSREQTKEIREKKSITFKSNPKNKTREIRYCSCCGGKINFANKNGICNSCRGNNSIKYKNKILKRKNYRKEFKLKLVDYKGGKCEICGYNKSLSALHFHHKNPKEKDFSIGQKKGTINFEKIKIEIDKCILVCANCHAEIHETMGP